MQVKKTCVARGTSPFITEADTSAFPSPAMKAGASSFIIKEGVSHIPYIERRALE
jgi:hypothetical protein